MCLWLCKFSKTVKDRAALHDNKEGKHSKYYRSLPHLVGCELRFKAYREDTYKDRIYLLPLELLKGF